MLIATHGVELYAHCYAWSEALCSLLYMECSFMRIAIHEVDILGVKLYARWLKWSEASCSMLSMERCFNYLFAVGFSLRGTTIN